MTPCDNRQLDSSKGHFAIGVSILLLALAVFGWGLHSKLSLYHVRAGASEAVPIAKLLSERERPSDTAEHCDLNPGDLHAVALALSVALIPQPAKQIVVAASRRESLPLPSRTLALKGPSLRRPPPSPLA
jgi:hypothetical protein